MDPSDTESLEAEPTATPLPAQSASSFAAARSAMAQIAAATSSESAERRNSTAAEAQDAPSEEEEETPTPAPPVKRGRPKGSKDAQPRTRTKPVHTPSKQYTHDAVHQMATELPQQSCYSPTELRCEAPSLRHYEEAMEHARQREVNRRQTMYESWLPY